MNLQPKCVICGEVAITTAAQIPVCQKHEEEYASEARADLPMSERTFYNALVKASRDDEVERVHRRRPLTASELSRHVENDEARDGIAVVRVYTDALSAQANELSKLRDQVDVMDMGLRSETALRKAAEAEAETLRAELARAREELNVTDDVLTERMKVMAVIPPCPEHGSNCVPGAVAWVNCAVSRIEELANELAASRVRVDALTAALERCIARLEDDRLARAVKQARACDEFEDMDFYHFLELGISADLQIVRAALKPTTDRENTQ